MRPWGRSGHKRQIIYKKTNPLISTDNICSFFFWRNRPNTSIIGQFFCFGHYFSIVPDVNSYSKTINRLGEFCRQNRQIVWLSTVRKLKKICLFWLRTWGGSLLALFLSNCLLQLTSKLEDLTGRNNYRLLLYINASLFGHFYSVPNQKQFLLHEMLCFLKLLCKAMLVIDIKLLIAKKHFSPF